MYTQGNLVCLGVTPGFQNRLKQIKLEDSGVTPGLQRKSVTLV